MMTSTIEGRAGEFPEEGIKAPVKVATAANITLSGEQTVNSVAVTAGDRVLVKDQTGTTQNGIYVVATGAWTRATDFDGGNDVVSGVVVVDDANDYMWKVCFTGSYTPDTTSVTFDNILSTGVADGGVTTVKLAADAVTGAKIADDAVDSEHLATDSVTSDAIAAGAVGSDELAFDTVNTGKLTSSAVTASKIAAGNIYNSHLASPSVDTDQLYSNAVSTAKISDEAVTEAKLATAVQSKLNAASGSFINGLGTSNGTDADHDIDIAAGTCPDSTGTVIMTGTADTIAIDDLGTDNAAGALNTLTWYHIFIVSDNNNENAAYFFDTSTTATNALAKVTNGTYYQKIASVYTDNDGGGANIYAYHQDEDLFLWDVGFSTSTTIGAAAITPTMEAPLGFETQVKIALFAESTSETNKYVLVTSPKVADTTPTSTLKNLDIDGNGTNVRNQGPFNGEILTNTSSQIRVRANIDSATCKIFVEGYVDKRIIKP